MSQNLTDFGRGYTGALSKAGLLIGDGAKTGVALAAPNGAGTDFAIDGILYHKADAATNLPFSAGTVVPLLSKCLFLVLADSAGAVTTVQGDSVLTADLVAGTKVLQWPAAPANKAVIGGVKITCASAATFTPGTTALDATNVTATYFDLSGAPTAPLTS